MTPDAFFRDYISTWEDGGCTDPSKTHSLDPVDNGNWTGGTCGTGACVGSNHGVTAAALAAFRGVPVDSITTAVMHALTLDEAARIAAKLYYHAPGLDRLPWDPVVASVIDFGWGAGPGQAIKLLERMVSVVPDGKLGLVLIGAYTAYLAKHGLIETASAWLAVRNGFYTRLVIAKPDNARFLKGWLRRSAYFAPGGDWWKRFTS